MYISSHCYCIDFTLLFYVLITAALTLMTSWSESRHCMHRFWLHDIFYFFDRPAPTIKDFLKNLPDLCGFVYRLVNEQHTLYIAHKLVACRMFLIFNPIHGIVKFHVIKWIFFNSILIFFFLKMPPFSFKFCTPYTEYNINLCFTSDLPVYRKRNI